MKKVWKFLGSMRFAILLLVILAAACALGSFIPQLQPYETYAETYSPRLAGLIVGLGLDDVFLMLTTVQAEFSERNMFPGQREEAERKAKAAASRRKKSQS